ncbi:galactosylgalactosylxylosylprotein 3-beta-glucuronosyltransferase sqv-8-like [Ciona intestinalis]
MNSVLGGNVRKEILMISLVGLFFITFLVTTVILEEHWKLSERKYCGRLQEELINSPDAYNQHTIHAITSTYVRLFQKADLTSLVQTLMHLHNFHWIVIEDSEEKTALVTKLLKKSGLHYTHLNLRNSEQTKCVKHLQTTNAALAWVRKHIGPDEGVVYFMDDDNTYDLKVFEDMRTTKVASVWPVGFATDLIVEGPALCKNGKVLTWRAVWKPDRIVPIDMAGFALSTAFLRQHPDVYFIDVQPLESQFLADLGLTKDRMEAKANNCTEVNVWHTRTKKYIPHLEDEALKLGPEFNPNVEV